MPFGLLLDIWECNRKFNGIDKTKRDVLIDDIIPYGI